MPDLSKSVFYAGILPDVEGENTGPIQWHNAAPGTVDTFIPENEATFSQPHGETRQTPMEGPDVSSRFEDASVIVKTVASKITSIKRKKPAPLGHYAGRAPAFQLQNQTLFVRTAVSANI